MIEAIQAMPLRFPIIAARRSCEVATALSWTRRRGTPPSSPTRELLVRVVSMLARLAST
jgi:hypothetical protein